MIEEGIRYQCHASCKYCSEAMASYLMCACLPFTLETRNPNKIQVKYPTRIEDSLKVKSKEVYLAGN